MYRSQKRPGARHVEKPCCGPPPAERNGKEDKWRGIGFKSLLGEGGGGSAIFERPLSDPEGSSPNPPTAKKKKKNPPKPPTPPSNPPPPPKKKK